MKVIIPLAGKGTRLRPHTHATPKPLIRVAGKEVLGHILDKIIPLNVTEVYFIAGHLHDQIEEYVRKSYPNLKFKTIKQDELKGTAHAGAQARDHIDEDVLISFADTLFEADLSVIKRLSDDIDGIIWAKAVENPQIYGVIEHNEQGLMHKIMEKPEDPKSNLVNIGMQYLRDSASLFAAIDYVLNQEPGPRGEYFLTDALQYMVDGGAKIKIEEVDAWLDCGNVEELLKTNLHLLNSGLAKKPNGNSINVKVTDPVMVAKDAILENVEIGPNVTIESGCNITGSKISNSIIGQGSIIDGAVLHDSLIGAEAVVRDVDGSLNVLDHSVVIGRK